MAKINWGSVGNYAKQLCEAASYVFVYVAASKGMKYVLECDSNELVGYDDAIHAIMHSSMYSHDKADAAAALKRYGDTAFYKAIVHIVKDSSTYSHDKLKMIKELSQN